MAAPNPYSSNLITKQGFVYDPLGKATVNTNAIKLMRVISLDPLQNNMQKLRQYRVLHSSLCSRVFKESPLRHVSENPFLLVPGRYLAQEALRKCSSLGMQLPEVVTVRQSNHLHTVLSSFHIPRIYAGVYTNPLSVTPQLRSNDEAYAPYANKIFHKWWQQAECGTLNIHPHRTNEAVTRYDTAYPHMDAFTNKSCLLYTSDAADE